MGIEREWSTGHRRKVAELRVDLAQARARRAEVQRFQGTASAAYQAADAEVARVERALAELIRKG